MSYFNFIKNGRIKQEKADQWDSEDNWVYFWGGAEDGYPVSVYLVEDVKRLSCEPYSRFENAILWCNHTETRDERR